MITVNLYMANINAKIVFKLLLIVTMVIQPVAITHAMASMDHSQHQASFANKQSHDGHHVMNQDIPDAQHDESTGNSDMNNCCNTAACCPAALVDITTLERTPVPEYSTHLHISWEGVILPSEIKPPQSLLG